MTLQCEQGPLVLPMETVHLETDLSPVALPPRIRVEPRRLVPDPQRQPHALRRNTRRGSRRNIRDHHDLKAEFDRLVSIEMMEAVGHENLPTCFRACARRLRRWRAAFTSRLRDVRGLGFDDRFIRLWNHYLCHCAAGWDEDHVDDLQIVLGRPGWQPVGTGLGPGGGTAPAGTLG